jgi:signal transduction histidine kinase
MSNLPITAWTPKAPLRIFALVLVLTFAVEGAIMLLLPLFPTWSHSPQFLGVVDATILTLIMAPVIWLLVVKPIQLLAKSREYLLHSLFQAQEQERSRIARDLHDEIGQQLTAMQVGLGTIEAAKDLQAAKQLARDLRKVGATAHEEVRRLSSGLRPGVLEELGLVVALERLCEDFEQHSSLKVRRSVSTEVGDNLTLPMETALYRILQESLTNVAKHAGASVVEVTLRREGETLILSVADDGHGIEPKSNDTQGSERSGLGLDFIRERVQMLQGICKIGRSELGGALIKVTIKVQH